jgi:hypothetical protein
VIMVDPFPDRTIISIRGNELQVPPYTSPRPERKGCRLSIDQEQLLLE